jgi:hypothetical protein
LRLGLSAIHLNEPARNLGRSQTLTSAVIALLGQHMACFALSQQRDRLGAVVRLTCRDNEVHRQTLLVGQQMDLGRQTSSGAPQSLVGAPFLRPAAAC